MFYRIIFPLAIFDILAYSLVLAFALRNTVKYLVKQSRYTEFHLLMFYVLSIMIAGSRILYFSLYLALIANDHMNYPLEAAYLFFSDFAVFSKAILGIF